MTYPLLVVPFLVVAAGATALSAMRPRFGARMRASAVGAVVLLALTAVFDNVMIALDLFTYPPEHRSEEHTSELQSLMRISYAVFCLKKKTTSQKQQITRT